MSLCLSPFSLSFLPFSIASFASSFSLRKKNTQATLAPLVRIQENVPQFKIPPLEPGREYHFQVYAVNAKGRSDPPYIIERVRVGSLISPYGKHVKKYFLRYSLICLIHFTHSHQMRAQFPKIPHPLRHQTRRIA
jgi:hypothetical protein